MSNIIMDSHGESVTPAAVASAVSEMSDEQIEQTRDYLGAGPVPLVVYVTESGGVYTASENVAAIYEAYEAGRPCVLEYAGYIYQLAYTVSNHAEFSLAFRNSTNNIWTIYSMVGHAYDGVEDEWTWRYCFVEEETQRVNVSGATPTIEPHNKTIYECGTLTSLTISSPSLGPWSVVFTSGSTPTTTTFPSTILGLEDFAAEANTMYEINVLDNRAVVGSWAVSSS